MSDAVSTSDEFVRPLPIPDAVSQGFWDAAAQGRLAVQYCIPCNTFQHPPSLACRTCGGTNHRFEAVSGRGRLWSWTTTHRSVLTGFDSALPYVNLVVELEEQPGLFMMSDLVGRAFGSELKLGAPVRADFSQKLEGGLVLPQFVADIDGDAK